MLDKERLTNLSDEIWKGAIKLRGKFKAKDYPTVILPMIMLRRIECMLEAKRELFRQEILAKTPDIAPENLAMRVSLLGGEPAILQQLTLDAEKNPQGKHHAGVRQLQ